MKEEKFLEEIYGKQEHFKVPEDYFVDFNARMMDLLPEQQARIISLQPSRWKQWRRYAAAACVCAVIGGAGWMFTNQHEMPAAQSVLSSGKQALSNDPALDEMADYVMLDNEDIYTYLADY